MTDQTTSTRTARLVLQPVERAPDLNTPQYEWPGWRNGYAMLADGQRIDVGGGWVHTCDTARSANAAEGLQTEAHPDIYWPGAVEEGDMEPYAFADIGDIVGLAEALGLDDDDVPALVTAVQAASREAHQSPDSEADIAVPHRAGAR